jgi:hypothetical protein
MFWRPARDVPTLWKSKESTMRRLSRPDGWASGIVGVRLIRLLTGAEHQTLTDDAVARGMYRNDRRVFLPGMAFEMPWYFDPRGELAAIGGSRKTAMITADRKGELGFLSMHYWRDWSSKRPPICVVCPNGEWWEIDRKSSNGDGWIVTGDFPNITCAPSIVVEGYHGFLRDGEFTPDIEGRGPAGTARPIVERTS